MINSGISMYGTDVSTVDANILIHGDGLNNPGVYLYNDSLGSSGTGKYTIESYTIND